MRRMLVNVHVRVEMRIVASLFFMALYQKVVCGMEVSCVENYCDHVCSVIRLMLIFIFYFPGSFFYQCLCLCSEATIGYS